MKRFLFHIALLLALFGPVYLWGIRLLGETPLHGNITYVPGNYGHMGSRLAEADTVGPVQVLFVGSSHCYRTFDTRLFARSGIRAFNLGSSNQSLIQTHTLLQCYLPKLQPEAVVIEVHPDIMALDGVESACDLLSNMDRNRALVGMVARMRSPRVVQTALYAWMAGDKRVEDSVISVHTMVNGEQVLCDFSYVRGGYVELPCHRYRPQPIKPRAIAANPIQRQALDDCLSLLQQYGCQQVTLLEVPCTHTLYASYQNHNDFELAMQEMARQHPNTRYINLNNRLPLVDTLHFFDEDHLNQQGATMVCNHLIDSLPLILKHL